MNQETFWKTIQESKESSASKPETQHEKLTAILKTMNKDELLGFARNWYQCHQNAYRWDLWAVAYMVDGGCSDDSFMDFRSWLIGQGKEVYEAIMKDPNAIVNIPDSELFFYEELGYVANEVYKEVTGEELPSFEEMGVALTNDPIGEEWDEDELEELYPEVCKRFDF